jgi:hypothetical protein
LWSAVLAGYALVMLGALVPGGTQVKCNQQCAAGYSADEDDCRYQYGTPADTDALDERPFALLCHMRVYSVGVALPWVSRVLVLLASSAPRSCRGRVPGSSP